MCNRDRQYERNFKVTFEDRSAVIQDLVTKVFICFIYNHDVTFN